MCLCRWKARWINSINSWRLTSMACLSLFCCWRRRNTQLWWLSRREMANTPPNKSSKAWTLCAETGVTWPRSVASQCTELSLALSVLYKDCNVAVFLTHCIFFCNMVVVLHDLFPFDLVMWLVRFCQTRTVTPSLRTFRNIWLRLERRWPTAVSHSTCSRYTR